MKLPRRVVYALLACFISLNLALRFPRTSHEIGVDSFFIHNLATNVVNDQRAEWMLNPLSLFGWYPLSYPSAGPFLLASFSDLSGFSIEAGILLLSLAFGTFGVLTSFAMAREFRDDDRFCLAVAFLYAFAPRYLSFTLWSASMRSLFMVLLPVFIWIVLRLHREPRIASFALLVVSFLILAATHRLAALLAAVMVAFLAAIMLIVLLRALRIRFPTIVLSSPFRRASPYLALGAFASMAGIMFFGTDILAEYSVGELSSGTTMQVQLLNFGVSLARSVGLSLVFAFIGVVVLVRLRNKTLREAFFILAFLALTPTLFLRQYTGFYILPFIAIFGALVVLGVGRLRGRRKRTIAIAGIFVASIVFSSGVLEYEIEHATVMSEQAYSSSLYVERYASEQNVLSNDGLLGIRVAAISSCHVLPVGGAGTTFQSPELLAYHYFTAEEVEANIVRVPLQDLTLDSDSPWITSSIQAEADWAEVMQSPFDGRSPILERYSPTYFLENRQLGGQFFAYGNLYPSLFMDTMHAGAYKVYESAGEDVWYVAAPRSS